MSTLIDTNDGGTLQQELQYRNSHAASSLWSGTITDTIHLLSMISVRHDGDLFGPFLDYYLNTMGIKPQSCIIFLHVDCGDDAIEKELKKLLHYAWSLNVEPIIYNGTFTSPRKRDVFHDVLDEVNNHYKDSARTHWIMHADADEFHSFKPLVSTGCEAENLKKLVPFLEQEGYSHVVSFWEDRIATGCVLTDVEGDKAMDMFHRFQCTVDIARQYTRHTHKISLHRLRLRPAMGGYHSLSGKDQKQLGRAATTYHFKWRSSVRKKLEERAQVYHKEGIHWWHQSEKALQLLEENLSCECSRKYYPDFQCFRSEVQS